MYENGSINAYYFDKISCIPKRIKMKLPFRCFPNKMKTGEG